MNDINWGAVSSAMNEAAVISAQAFDRMAQAFREAAPRYVMITDEMTFALQQAGHTGWMAGYKWNRDLARCLSHGVRVRTPRREKRRARKRRGKR
jgi:hypothetical protein